VGSTDYPSLLSPWVMGGAAKALFKTYGKSGIADRLPTIANVAISNVPGPQVPLYLAGARMRTFHPLSIVLHGLALNITIQTYAGSVDFGIIADKKAVPHVQDLASMLEAAFAQAKTLFVAEEPAAPAKVVAKPRKKAAATVKTRAPARKRRMRDAVSG
jgi:diacylglycerol O-acyltransferase / wax synthase